MKKESIIAEVGQNLRNGSVSLSGEPLPCMAMKNLSFSMRWEGDNYGHISTIVI